MHKKYLKYLFIGGPRHGKYERVDSELQHVIVAKFSSVNSTTTLTTTVRYDKTPLIHSGSKAYIFAIEGLTHEAAFKAFENFLAEQWISTNKEEQMTMGSYVTEALYKNLYSKDTINLNVIKEDIEKHQKEYDKKLVAKYNYYFLNPPTMPNPNLVTLDTEVDKINKLIPGLDQTVPVKFLKKVGCNHSCSIKITGMQVRTAIFHLNDYHNWTFEQIAKWLESLPIDLKVKKGD